MVRAGYSPLLESEASARALDELDNLLPLRLQEPVRSRRRLAGPRLDGLPGRGERSDEFLRSRDLWIRHAQILHGGVRLRTPKVSAWEWFSGEE